MGNGLIVLMMYGGNAVLAGEGWTRSIADLAERGFVSPGELAALGLLEGVLRRVEREQARDGRL